MKLLKYAFVALMLMCFLTADVARAQTEDVYMLTELFIGANVGNDGSVPVMTVRLFGDNSEVDLRIAENARFIASPLVTGLQTDQITFAQFAERFVGHVVDFDFVVREGEYFVIECRLILVE